MEVGRAATFTIDDLEYPAGIAGYHIDFHEEHHGNAIAKIRGLIVGIKTVFVDEFADGKRRIDNPHNTFVIYDATLVDGYGDKGDYGFHRKCDACYYIIIMKDVIVGEYEGRYEHLSSG